MRTEERTHFEVLLENIQTSVNVIAEGHGARVEGHAALVERLDRMESRFESRFDRLEVFASDAKQRLDRIETHRDASPAERFEPFAPTAEGDERRPAEASQEAVTPRASHACRRGGSRS